MMLPSFGCNDCGSSNRLPWANFESHISLFSTPVASVAFLTPHLLQKSNPWLRNWVFYCGILMRTKDHVDLEYLRDALEKTFAYVHQIHIKSSVPWLPYVLLLSPYCGHKVFPVGFFTFEASAIIFASFSRRQYPLPTASTWWWYDMKPLKLCLYLSLPGCVFASFHAQNWRCISCLLRKHNHFIRVGYHSCMSMWKV